MKTRESLVNRQEETAPVKTAHSIKYEEVCFCNIVFLLIINLFVLYIYLKFIILNILVK